MNELIDKFYERIDLSDVICEKCSKNNGKTSRAKFLTNQSVLKTPMHLRIFLQRLEYNGVKYIYCKIK